jgi:hypothetical protein
MAGRSPPASGAANEMHRVSFAAVVGGTQGHTAHRCFSYRRPRRLGRGPGRCCTRGPLCAAEPHRPLGPRRRWRSRCPSVPGQLSLGPGGGLGRWLSPWRSARPCTCRSCRFWVQLEDDLGGVAERDPSFLDGVVGSTHPALDAEHPDRELLVVRIRGKPSPRSEVVMRGANLCP